MQGVGRVGYLLDPDDNIFGLISPVMSDGTVGMGGGVVMRQLVDHRRRDQAHGV